MTTNKHIQQIATPDYESIAKMAEHKDRLDQRKQRAEFAGMAMQAFANTTHNAQECAELSVKYADALIKELNK